MKILFSILWLIFLFSCSGKKTVATKEDPTPREAVIEKVNTNYEQGLQEFLKRFETAVLAHHKADMLEFFDKDYKADRHDKALGGDTNKFLDEFFCNYQTNGQGFKCLKFAEISELKRIEVMPNDKNYTVVYHVTGKGGTIKCDYLVMVRKEAGKTVYGFYGTGS